MIDHSKPPLPPVRQRATDDVSLTIEWEDGHTSAHWYRPGIAEYLTTRYTPEAKAAGRAALVITYTKKEGEHDGDNDPGGAGAG